MYSNMLARKLKPRMRSVSTQCNPSKLGLTRERRLHPYNIFVKAYRQKSGVFGTELFRQAALQWSGMSYAERQEYSADAVNANRNQPPNRGRSAVSRRSSRQSPAISRRSTATRRRCLSETTRQRKRSQSRSKKSRAGSRSAAINTITIKTSPSNEDVEPPEIKVEFPSRSPLNNGRSSQSRSRTRGTRN